MTRAAIVRLVSVCVVAFALTGCVSAEVHRTAVSLQAHLATVRRASRPHTDMPAIIYERAWDEAERAAADVERASR